MKDAPLQNPFPRMFSLTNNESWCLDDDQILILVSTIIISDQGSVDVALKTPPTPSKKSKCLGSRGSMVTRLKLKGIYGRAAPGVEPTT